MEEVTELNTCGKWRHAGGQDWNAKKVASYRPVSYTHLTLPTSDLV